MARNDALFEDAVAVREIEDFFERAVAEARETEGFVERVVAVARDKAERILNWRDG